LTQAGGVPVIDLSFPALLMIAIGREILPTTFNPLFAGDQKR
jgi:hypothetical protein